MRTRKGIKKLDTHSLTKLTFDSSPLFLLQTELLLVPLGYKSNTFLGINCYANHGRFRKEKRKV